MMITGSEYSNWDGRDGSEKSIEISVVLFEKIIREKKSMSKTESFSFGPWKVTSTKGSILKADEAER